jgi:hypothetical protein
MTLIANPWHWLTPEGEIPLDNPDLRRNILRVARVIEYGALLAPGEFRDTLIECTKRSAGKQCPGLQVVVKNGDDSILAFCPVCGTDHIIVRDWNGTRWAHGQAEARSEPS